MLSHHTETRLGRRAFLKEGTLILTASSLLTNVVAAEKTESFKMGLVTDLHYADKAAVGTRHYRETLGKLEEAGREFAQAGVSCVIELGDLIDAADSVDVEQRYLKTVNREFSAICRDRHYVLGNHCVDTLTKSEFLGSVEQEKSYYAFDRGGVHFIVLDSCFTHAGVPYGRKNFKWTDANIPRHELEWLAADLRENQKPVVVFAHQRLDVDTSHGVKNNAEVRAILETAGNVLAVFQGHSHKNDLKEIHGIHYCTLVAMVEGSGQENNGYSVMTITGDQTIELTGFRQQQSRQWQL